MRLTGGMVNVLEAAAGESLPKFRTTAYTGGAMRLTGFYRPVVVDLSGLTAGKNLPALREHDADRIVGHHTNIEIKPSAIIAEGVFSGGNAESETIINAGKNISTPIITAALVCSDDEQYRLTVVPGRKS